MVQIHSPRPFFLDFSIAYAACAASVFRQFSVHLVQLKATRTQIRTALPTFCGTPRPLSRNLLFF